VIFVAVPVGVVMLDPLGLLVAVPVGVAVPDPLLGLIVAVPVGVVVLDPLGLLVAVPVGVVVLDPLGLLVCGNCNSRIYLESLYVRDHLPAEAKPVGKIGRNFAYIVPFVFIVPA
jgi:hypothetical protein